MNVREFYQMIGGDYDMAKSVFRTDARIYQYLKLYVEDDAYVRLCSAVTDRNTQEAFEAVHIMKGTTGTLFFTRLHQVVVELVEQLRPQNQPIDEELFRIVSYEQQLVLKGIQEINL